MLPPHPKAGYPDVEAYLAECIAGSWHLVLNHHASQRPKDLGGPIVRSVTGCKTYTKGAPGSASGPWRCNLCLPDSFARGDGRRVHTHGEGSTKKEASDQACRAAVVDLLATSPHGVLLHSHQWGCSLGELRAHVATGGGAGNRTQAPPAPSSASASGAAAGSDQCLLSEMD